MFSHFFLVFIVTVVSVRIFLYFRPTASPTVRGLRLHHYMYGIVGIILGVAFNILTVFAVGLGLFIDELTFLLIRGRTHEDNYSKASLLGTLFFVILVFFTQEYLLNFLNFL
jgi:ABC-type multidrug transport system fused ATPase/permease subunit